MKKKMEVLVHSPTLDAESCVDDFVLTLEMDKTAPLLAACSQRAFTVGQKVIVRDHANAKAQIATVTKLCVDGYDVKHDDSSATELDVTEERIVAAK